MSYIEQITTELTAKLNAHEDTASIVRWVSDKLMASYRNGIIAGQKGAVVKRNGKSQDHGSATKAE